MRFLRCSLFVVLSLLASLSVDEVVRASRASAVSPTSASSGITVNYPEQDSIFPPDMAPPTFIWHDTTATVLRWRVEVLFQDGAIPLHATANGPRPRIGEIDPDCVSSTNKPPQLPPGMKSAHTWSPDAAMWESIKKHSTVIVKITGIGNEKVISRGQVTIHISKDPVGAPIFYRDVPLMPSQTQTGIIKPLADDAVRLIAWRLRNVSEPRSHLLMTGMPMCANCHSFSNDGKTLGMDMDGLNHNRGMYTLTPVASHTEIRHENLIQWTTADGPLKGDLRIGFMSQVSPNGEYVVTTIDSVRNSKSSNYYVANFTDYRFLQVFYPTRGILAWYSKKTGILTPLPGADDPRFVQMGAVWSPDGKYLVFARATATDPNPKNATAARFANDPNEVQIKYDLYRIPFRDGKGGTPEPIRGASQNGMSNSFPKISPDGRWIVFVKARNGLLMRPDSELYIVPAEGGEARRLRANAAPMNSWHSFSPNGRWLVFSSKRQGPYTRMYLTHIDENGNDSPAILIENVVAANRAVNIPEFVNIAPDGFRQLGGPVVDYFKQFDRAMYFQRQRRFDEASAAWTHILKLHPDDAIVEDNLGMALMLSGHADQAASHIAKAKELNLKEALQTSPNNPALHNDYGLALLQTGRVDEACEEFNRATNLDGTSVAAFTNLGQVLLAQHKIDEALPVLRKACDLDPGSTEAHALMGNALQGKGDLPNALSQWRESVRLTPNYVPALRQLAWRLATSPDNAVRNADDAVAFGLRALQATAGKNASVLDALAAAYAEAGRFDAAATTARRALLIATPEQSREIIERIQLYESHKPYRDTIRTGQ